MKRILFCLAISQLLCAVAVGSADNAASEFDHPWNKQQAAIVIDPFEKNEIDWSKLSLDPKLVGIIHRATIGFRMDKKYLARRTEAKRRGYKWGSYHFGVSGDPVKQAHFYLDFIKPWDGELMALDIEALDSSSMTLHEAALFVSEIKRITGRLPVIYANDDFTRQFNENSEPIMAQTQLWYARPQGSILDFPRGVWRTYLLWQFSSELNCAPRGDCLYRVPGTYHDMDISVYNGTIEQLKESWPFDK